MTAVALEFGYPPLSVGVTGDIRAGAFSCPGKFELGRCGCHINEAVVMGGPVAETVSPVAAAATIGIVAGGAGKALADNVLGVTAADVREHAAVRPAVCCAGAMAIPAG